MSYIHPTYNAIREQFMQNITNNVTGSVPLSNSLTRIFGETYSQQIALLYSYMDYIALQACPSTATGAYLDDWGGMKNVTRKSASPGSAYIQFTGDSAATVPAQIVLVAPNGQTYITQSACNPGETVEIIAVNSGTQSNQLANTILTLQTPVAGVDSSLTVVNAISNGADMESDDLYRIRIMDQFSTVPVGGSQADHVNWALAVPGVTAAWVPAVPMAGAQVVIYIMMDRTNATKGYPQGTDGTATDETRYPNATGDQLTVANAIWSQRPYTEIQIVTGPIETDINFTIAGLSTETSAVQTAINTSIQTVLHQQGTPLGTRITLASIESAIQQAANTTSFTLTAPSTDIVLTAGKLPELGTVTYQ